MSRNINFVRERRKTISRQELDDKKVLAVVIKGLVVLGVVILVVVGARLYFLFQVKSNQRWFRMSLMELLWLLGSLPRVGI